MNELSYLLLVFRRAGLSKPGRPRSDQTPQIAASDLGLHSLPLIYNFSGTSTGSKMIFIHI